MAIWARDTVLKPQRWLLKHSNTGKVPPILVAWGFALKH
jgi:hypothetical protein